MSVNQITAQFRTIYQDEFKYDFDREMAKMKIAVRSDGVVNGATAYFDVVDPADEAIEKTRDGRVPKSDLGLSQVPATLKKIHKKYQIDNFDLFRANKNTRAAMSKRGRGSINKGIDKEIFRKLDATSVVHPDGTVTANTLAVIQRATLVLWNKDIPDDGEVFGVVTPAFWAQMMRINEFKSVDFTTIKPADSNAIGMRVRNWMGVNWFTHTGLTGNGTATSNNFIFHKSAVGHMCSGEPAPHLFTSEEDDYEGVRFDVMHAACVPLPRGVIKIVHNDTAALA
jgi:hypothetical protein